MLSREDVEFMIEERAAIMEFDGGIRREAAMKLARQEHKADVDSIMGDGNEFKERSSWT